ncbi:alkaline phosphatase family protein [Edaphobacter sp.]|uniref:alkaline phosphatase family protein n=1 Tax=Edaphobacter sp. TaxID=1934404 RepID=UPI002DBB26A9|nr:alkaline phosphatase family protein [Edaphobacter sp.]HEU5340523.1 alkaline phosphatase family protein [Edaphobacter sp.]
MRYVLCGIASLAVSATLLAGCGSGGIPPVKAPLLPIQQAVPPSPITHVVIIMQENRSFDNLFNGFPGADTTLTGVHNGQKIALQPLALGSSLDLEHSHRAWWRDWNYGKLDGFKTDAYAYVPEADVEAYWRLAYEYTLGDRMFQSNTGPSFVAHQYMIAGQSGKTSENPSGGIWGCDAADDSRVALVGPNGTDLPGVYPCFDYPTMADLLDAHDISWRYYAPGSTNGFFIISAYQAIRHIRFGSDWVGKVISPETEVLKDIHHGKLAQVTWIVPSWKHSDHPGSGDEGPDWVASIVNAIGESPFWDSTAIFISWDDWGGWYDHVNPPRLDEMGLGFRVPVLVVSPYARHGYISHQTHEASGFLTYIEHNFGLPNLGTRDTHAAGFTDCFDYTQPPRAYIPLPTRHTPHYLIHEAPSGPPDDD